MTRNVDFYLSKGFDRPMAEYFASGRKKVTSATPNKDFTLTLEFDNGEKRLYDCKPFLEENTVFAPFMIYENFKRVYVDNEHCVAWDINPSIDSNIVWNNKVDIGSDTCYVDSEPIA